MINNQVFFKWLTQNKVNFFSGVPDSLLKDICAYITDNTSKENHIIAANEGNAVALAAGYHLATDGIPMVYMQNSGIGNAVNPLLSLTDKKVYNIPLLMLIGWRGEPGVKDEPQHIAQGEATTGLLDALQIPYEVLSPEPEKAQHQVENAVAKIRQTNTVFALVVQKGTFEKYTKNDTSSADYTLCREDAIKQIIGYLDGSEVIVSTTGKTSRELFELRENLKQPHHSDFLTVGSMGHASQIALGIAINKPGRRIICIDGDGALLMHMGGMAITGTLKPDNFIHIVINNGEHESVGGQPTVGLNIDMPELALSNGYKSAVRATNESEVVEAVQNCVPEKCPALIEIRVRSGSRKDLGRPTIAPVDNKKDFMKNLGI